MTLKEKFILFAKSLKLTALSSPAVFVFIFLLGISQLFYSMFPLPYLLNWLFCSSAVLILSDRFKNVRNVKKYLLYLCISVFIIQLYCFALFTYNVYVEQACISLVWFYCFLAVLLYFSPFKDYHKEVKRRIIHILVSLCFFAAVYIFVYSTAFFIDNIFNLNLEYTDSYLFRAANAAASIIGMLVFSSCKKEEYGNSKLFILMFKDIIPRLLIPFFIFALTYIIKIILFFDKNDYFEFNNYYYIFTFIIFICFVMMQNFEDTKNKQKFLFIISAIIPVFASVFLIRYHIENYKTFINVFISFKRNFIYNSVLHKIIINLVISIYYFYCLAGRKIITRNISFAFAVILLVWFMPVIGCYNIGYLSCSKEIYKEKNNLTHFKEKKIPKDDINHYSYSKPSFRENIESVIDTAGYEKIILSIFLYSDNGENNVISYEDFEFYLSKDGKLFSVFNAETKKTEVFDIFSSVKNKMKEDKSFIEFETEVFLIIIENYSYSNWNNYVRLTFDIYIKK